jgi:hypothetical protein
MQLFHTDATSSESPRAYTCAVPQIARDPGALSADTRGTRLAEVGRW